MKKFNMAAVAGAVLLASGTAGAMAQQRAAADVSCTPGEGRLAYDCVAAIRDQVSEAPLEGLGVEVKADMPSMPMAHNIPPVTAEPTGEPGQYGFSLTLDMHGVWSFTMRLTGEREDLVVELLDFQDGMDEVKSGASADSAGHGHGGHGSGHGHSGHGTKQH
jgi:hypothetical protein